MAQVALVVDGTAKTCKGVIAGLERGMHDLAPGELVLAIVDDIPTRVDVYAWAQRKGHRMLDERRQGSGYILHIAKGGSGQNPRRVESGRDAERTERASIEGPARPEAGP